MGSFFTFSVVLTARMSTNSGEFARDDEPADVLHCENCIELKPTTNDNDRQFSWNGLLKSVFGGERVDPQEELQQIAPSKVEPELEAFLNQWEVRSRNRTSVTFDFTRREFDRIFREEKRTKGLFRHRAPNHFFFVTEPWNPELNESSERRDRSGQPYRIEAGSSETWVWTDMECLIADNDDKTFLAGRISEPCWFNFFEPQPFLFDVNSERLRKEWNMQILAKTTDSLTIDACPRTQSSKRYFNRCRMTVNTQDYYPIELQFLDGSHREIWYWIQNWRTDGDFWDLTTEHANLKSKGYTRVPPGDE